ncbi:PP2C family protein-serine/threonine phosphatase [Thalassovita sp.]|uniref:PP2C family protein-serine/threonine phosphatase n=1 Tax=Thalassovita sp. TaxID=1979401 RepID=UPI0028828269|nr:SpoIIE family protein phosphatase [Thalassovita sp.]MDF1802207.1 SpoIIE family protein phosphatase [Thalassovita sp.]
MPERQTSNDAEENGSAIQNVLIVDDSRLQRRILAASLARWGYSVTEANSAEEALEHCAENQPDLVLSDWMMPGMDGLEFCQTFRKLPRDSYGYFILLTSKTEKEAVARGLDCGADDFLTKPVNAAELRARINAGERILRMERELTEKNKLVGETLTQLQSLYDALDSDLIEAKKLQQSLVRERYRDFGLAQVSLLLRPSGHVGGDLVGMYPITETRVGLFAIDVSGHGISSALMTARLAGYLSSAVPDQNIALEKQEDGRYAPLPPSDVVERLNTIVLEEMETEHYFTLLLADVDMVAGRVDMVQAGHPHPMIQHVDGSCSIVGVGGMPVGLLPGVSFDQSEIVLQPGERLVIQSDGVTECPAPDETMLEEEGLIAMLEELKDVRGTALMEALIWRLADFAGNDDFPDDVSAILLEYQGEVSVREP